MTGAPASETTGTLASETTGTLASEVTEAQAEATTPLNSLPIPQFDKRCHRYI